MYVKFCVEYTLRYTDPVPWSVAMSGDNETRGGITQPLP